MSGMFNDAKIDTLDVSGWDTSNVTNMNAMVYKLEAFSAAINNFDISNVTDLVNFAGNTTLPTSVYDATLIAWDGLIVTSSLTADFGSSTYTTGGAAESARTSLINNDLWTINDGGGA